MSSECCRIDRSLLSSFTTARVSRLVFADVDKHSDDYQVYKFSNRSIRFPDLSRRHRDDYSVQLSNLIRFARANASGSSALERVPFVRSCLTSRLVPIDVIIVEKCRAIGYESRRIIIIGKNVNNDYRKSFAGGRIATLFSHFFIADYINHTDRSSANNRFFFGAFRSADLQTRVARCERPLGISSGGFEIFIVPATSFRGDDNRRSNNSRRARYWYSWRLFLRSRSPDNCKIRRGELTSPRSLPRACLRNTITVIFHVSRKLSVERYARETTSGDDVAAQSIQPRSSQPPPVRSSPLIPLRIGGSPIDPRNTVISTSR